MLELDEEALLRDGDLAETDPGLHSLLNVNDQDEYERALARAAPAVTVRRPGRDPLPVRAATLAAAAPRPAPPWWRARIPNTRWPKATRGARDLGCGST